MGQAVRHALSVGYRLLDGAAAYGNEKEVGEALAESIRKGVVRREEVFVVSKLFNTKHVWEGDISRCHEAIDTTLADLQLEQLARWSAPHTSSSATHGLHHLIISDPFGQRADARGARDRPAMPRPTERAPWHSVCLAASGPLPDALALRHPADQPRGPRRPPPLGWHSQPQSVSEGGCPACTGFVCDATRDM